ncbi:MAG: porin family protein [Alphaproteobacteria bacterium]|nr:porin family protein [Alphaproteobacteria bacterium]
MRKLLILAGIFTVLAYNNAQARYYEENGYYYEERPRYERQVRYREEPKYARQEPIRYRRLSNEEVRKYEERQLTNTASSTIRPYIGVDIATTKMKFSSVKDEDGDSFNYKEVLPASYTAYSLNAGAKFNQNFGIEAFIQQSSEETKTDDWDYKEKIQFNAIGIDLIGYLPVSHELELLASLGLAQYNFNLKEEIDYDDYYEWEKSTLNTIGYRFGIGAQYNINEHIALRAMARYIKFSDDDIIKNMTELSLGLRYMF